MQIPCGWRDIAGRPACILRESINRSVRFLNKLTFAERAKPACPGRRNAADFFSGHWGRWPSKFRLSQLSTYNGHCEL